jgi:hypothetical protein
MGYYAMAFSMFVLACVIAFLCKYIFSELHRRNRDIQEKEGKLLEMYENVEDFMEVFQTGTRDSKDEMRSLREEIELLKTIQSLVEEAQPEEAPEPAKPPAQNADDTQRDVPEIVDAPAQPSVDEADEAEDAEPENVLSGARGELRDDVMRLYGAGRSKCQIARELGVTQSEVELIIVMHAGARAS